MVYLVLLDDPFTPGNVSLYLKNYLCLFRLSGPSITLGTNDDYDSSREEEYSSTDALSSSNRDTLLQQSGYGPFFVSNIPILFSFLMLAGLIWASSAVKNSAWVPYPWRQKFPTLMRSEPDDELFMCNLTLRLWLTFFLEIAICTFLSLQASELSSTGAVFEWLISLAFLLVIIAFLAFLAVLLAKSDVLTIPGYYQKLTLWSLLCWGTRPIDPVFDYKAQLKKYREEEVARRREILLKIKNRKAEYKQPVFKVD